MSKYIDADKIIAFLENEKAENIIGGDYSDGVLDTCDNILAFIDSLQQEQPKMDLEKEIEKYFNGWTETDEGIACHYQYVDLNTCRSIAHHFYELGQREMRHRITNPEYNAKVVERLKSEYPTIKEDQYEIH